MSILFVAFLLMANLIIDSAAIRSERRSVADAARQAARAAVQAVDVNFYRLTGAVVLNSREAARAASEVLQASGYSGTVSAVGSTARVPVTGEVAVRLFAFDRQVQVAATHVARATQGVSSALR